MKRKVVLLLGGLDTSTGAGLCLDARVCDAYGAHYQSIALNLAIQSDQQFDRLVAVSIAEIQKTLNALSWSTIASIKIGALGSVAHGATILQALPVRSIAAIVDPVLASSSGGLLIQGSARQIRHLFLEQLGIKTTLFCPNLPESKFLLGRRGKCDPQQIASQLCDRMGCAIYLKGGHATGSQITDIFCDRQQGIELTLPRLRKKAIRGTGCALATALACELAFGKPLPQAAERARANLQQWIAQATRVRGDSHHLLQAAK